MSCIFQTTLATTDTSCESVVTSGQHHLTPQHPPRDASPAGLVNWTFLMRCFHSFVPYNGLVVVIVFFFYVCIIMANEYFSCLFSRLLSIAEETLAEFLSKATGTAVEWVQMPGMKVTTLLLSLFNILNAIDYSLWLTRKKFRGQ